MMWVVCVMWEDACLCDVMWVVCVMWENACLCDVGRCA